jgi:predicted phage terminase large subunit-like protein
LVERRPYASQRVRLNPLERVAAWKDAQTVWDMAMFGLRLGRNPRVIVTTTPRPIKIIRDLLARDGKDVRVTRGKTADNAKNLAPTFLDSIVGRYQGTRLGRQELDAEILLDIDGAPWTHAMLETARKPHFAPDMERVVVAVDPSGTGGAKDGSDAVGIVVAGRSDGRAYVLADRTIKASPEDWGRRAVEAYRSFGADRLVAERNFGGAMVEHVVRTIDPYVSYREVSASRGKVQRAEPIAALYEQGRVTHAGDLTQLEEQMLAMTSQGFQGDGSPDRVDALVWALTGLMITPQRPQLLFG